MKLTAVIVDDERRNRELLNQLLATHCENVQVLALCETVDLAIEVINTRRPDIVFLDVQMGNDFGFDILPSLTPPQPSIIITTAHEQYAIKAVKAQALDYLLKPIVSDELKNAVNRVVEQKQKDQDVNNPVNASPGMANDKRITIPTAEGLLFIKAENIIRCEASGAYTEIFLKDKSKLMTSMNLGEFENILPESWGFLRVHHSSIINLAEVAMYVKGEGGKVVMSDKSTVQVSQRKKPAFLEAIKNFSGS
jgi:two-component system, LytTR family, response regulator